ncbi:zf-HC2 domain-containing protein [Streptomyces sp. URMC 129]|uniref:zf-HC2 domain-containing protein n=1 Tax=Streptomyces sp. URMC 129 TaxID=3423407 RepID=UPI003F1DABDE
MSADPFAMYDGAYVLGALSPHDRAEFEEHLRGCDGCARAVGELAGLPGLLGLLGQVAPGGGELGLRPGPPAASLLPALLARVARERRRRRGLAVLTAAGGVTLAACLVVSFTLTGASGSTGAGGDERPTVAAMTPLGNWPVSADIMLVPAEDGGGTRVRMECRYGGDQVGDYVLVAIDHDGAADELARWHVLPEETARVAVSTPLPRADIRSLEIRTPSGLPVLRTSLQ